MNNQQYHPSFHRHLSRSLHERFISTLKDLRGVTDTDGRQIHIDDLKSIHDESVAFIADFSDNLDAQALCQLNHIAGRTVDDHLTLSGGNDHDIISTY